MWIWMWLQSFRNERIHLYEHRKKISFKFFFVVCSSCATRTMLNFLPHFLVQFDWFHSMLQQLLANDQFNRNSAMSSLNSLSAAKTHANVLNLHNYKRTCSGETTVLIDRIWLGKTKEKKLVSSQFMFTAQFFFVFRHHFNPSEVQWCCDISSITIFQNQLRHISDN